MKLLDENLMPEQEQEELVIVKKKRGRKPGSKNKIKELDLAEDIVQEDKEEVVAVEQNVEIEPDNNIESTTDNSLDEDLEFQEFLSKINIWKESYKKIFKNEFDERIIIWRRLKRGEYKEITSSQESMMDKQELIAKTVILYPESDIVNELIEENGAFATLLAEEVLAKSGFGMSMASEL